MDGAVTRSSILAAIEEVRPELEAAVVEIEATRKLPLEVVKALKGTGVFGMTMPRSLGGPELDPFDQWDIIETLSRIDGSIGWCAMIGSDAGYYSAWLSDDATRELWRDPDAVTAGWLFPGGRAVVADGGYRVSGQWSFGSGCTHADVIVGSALVYEPSGDLRTDADGTPAFLTAVMPAEQVEILDTWYTTGLAGSGSTDYRVDDVFVPDAHTFNLLSPPRRGGPLYSFNAMFFANIGAVPLGVARAALDELLGLAETKVTMPTLVPWKEEARVQRAAAEVEIQIASARAYMLDVLRQMWTVLCAGDALDAGLRARFRLATMHTFQAAKRAVDLVYETAGTTAIFTRTSPLDRMYRDATTMAQHLVGSTKNLEAGGRVLLGLEAGVPLF
jgi:alkylation response protein AidB-like acyl-CoA dehydrogenase